MLAFLMGIRLCLDSPHGSIPGMWKLGKYLDKHFHHPGMRIEDLLLGELEHLPFHDACVLVADLIKGWRESGCGHEELR